MKTVLLIFLIASSFLVRAVPNEWSTGLNTVYQDSIKIEETFRTYLGLGVGVVGISDRYGDYDSRNLSYRLTYQAEVGQLLSVFSDTSLPEWIMAGSVISYVSHNYEDSYWGRVRVNSVVVAERNVAFLDEAFKNRVKMPRGLKIYAGFDVGYEFEWANLLEVESDFYEAALFSSNRAILAPFVGLGYYPLQQFGGYIEFSGLQSFVNFGLSFRW